MAWEVCVLSRPAAHPRIATCWLHHVSTDRSSACLLVAVSCHCFHLFATVISAVVAQLRARCRLTAKDRKLTSAREGAARTATSGTVMQWQAVGAPIEACLGVGPAPLTEVHRRQAHCSKVQARVPLQEAPPIKRLPRLALRGPRCRAPLLAPAAAARVAAFAVPRVNGSGMQLYGPFILLQQQARPPKCLHHCGAGQGAPKVVTHTPGGGKPNQLPRRGGRTVDTLNQVPGRGPSRGWRLSCPRPQTGRPAER